MADFEEGVMMRTTGSRHCRLFQEYGLAMSTARLHVAPEVSFSMRCYRGEDRKWKNQKNDGPHS